MLEGVPGPGDPVAPTSPHDILEGSSPVFPGSFPMSVTCCLTVPSCLSSCLLRTRWSSPRSVLLHMSLSCSHALPQLSFTCVTRLPVDSAAFLLRARSMFPTLDLHPVACRTRCLSLLRSCIAPSSRTRPSRMGPMGEECGCRRTTPPGLKPEPGPCTSGENC